MVKKAFIAVALFFTLISVLAGVLLIVLPVDPDWRYYYKGTIHLQSDEEIALFKMAVVDYGLDLAPDQIATIASPGGTVAIFNIHAEAGFPYGEERIDIRDASWVSGLVVIHFALPFFGWFIFAGYQD
ncbi:hypothetical protein LCGC14_1407190 [marine sediment metagenome]|uniref:Uncharacterized protein n=1 Tax=marine sediment metagenome TaxID=412755 RepID=A0A0F9JVE8_9ZZZZ